MSAAKWEPAESRIRQLFLDEERNYKEVMTTVNQEFGFTATERQYKAKVLQMKLKRNVEASKRKAVVQHILHRKQSSVKVTKFIRVQGHRKTEAIIQKWMKEYPMWNSSIPCTPLSPLPSQISLRTGSPVESPNLSKSSWLHAAIETPVERLLRYAQGPNTVVKSEQCGAILNDFQQILSSGSDISQCPIHDKWGSAVEEDLINIRNRLNLTNEVRLDNEHKDLSQSQSRSARSLVSGPFKINRGVGSKTTTYGRVTAIFWQRKSSLQNDDIEEDQSTQNPIAAQIAIHPNGKTSSPVRIVLDFDTCLNPSARITYQAVVPNNSEIFTIIEDGKLEDLVRVLESNTASLSDRDENGRSLLNYAKTFHRVDMLKFLLETGSDPDAIEPSWDGSLRPIALLQIYITADYCDDFDLNAKSECFKLMFEANADVDMNDGNDRSVFEYVLKSETLTTLKHVIHLGGPLVHPRMLTSDDGPRSAKCSPLMTLVSEAGYRYGSTLHVLEKAIMLLKWGVEVSCRDLNGNTLLHRTLCCDRAYPELNGLRPFSEPGELLKIFIAAGADIYALNNAGRSVSRTARNFGREKEWSEALQFCGFDAEEVIAQTMPKYKPYMGPRRTSTVSFEEYCESWSEEEWTGKMSWGDVAYSEKNYDTADESGVKYDYWEKGNRWRRRFRKQYKINAKKSMAKAKRKAEAGSSDAVGVDCCCSENHFPKAPQNMVDEDESENEDSTDDSTECSSDYPLEAFGYSSGDDSDDELAGHYYKYYLEGCPSDEIDETDHSTAMDSGEDENPASTEFQVTENSSVNNDIQLQLADPLLYADEGRSTAGSWIYAASEGRRNEDTASMNSVNFQEMEAPFDGAFQTEFDAFMTDS